jgi:hypothetical protein
MGSDKEPQTGEIRAIEIHVHTVIQIAIRVTFPLRADDLVYSVFWLLLFDYRLELRPLFQVPDLKTICFEEPQNFLP